MPKHRVLFVTAELTPVAKIGGLADVAEALPLALNRTGAADARLMIPYYDVIREAGIETSAVLEMPVPVRGREERVRLLSADISGNFVYLLEHEGFFGHGGIYYERTGESGSFKEISRFLFFSQAATALTGKLPDFFPEIVHCQDWHTGLVPALLKRTYGEDAPATVFTIHNLGMPGRWNREEIVGFLGIPADAIPTFSAVDRHGNIALIEQGILASDVVNTVSKTYAKEILTEEYGQGLEGTLQKRAEDLYGIINGIQTERFNPATDGALVQRYTAEDAKEKRPANKRALQKELRLEQNPDIPLFGFVGRLTNQKGMKLIVEAFPRFLKRGVQLAILGTGSPDNEALVRKLVEDFPGKSAAVIDFDAALAQRIYAGSDFFLMPSRFEPSGLGQLIALRYGAVPVVRSTGGLVETVPDYTSDPARGLGFRFGPFTGEALTEAVARAQRLFVEDRNAYLALQKRGMEQDVSWERSAPEYATLYEKALAKKGG